MKVYFPVGANNLEAAIKTMDWARTLGPSGHDLVVIGQYKLDVSRVVELGQATFATVSSAQYDIPPGWSWPHAKNAAWQAAARVENASPWLWWEPDAIPLKNGWVDDLAAAHKECGKPILGCHLANGHIDGVAVYPPGISGMSRSAMLCRAAPFDQTAGIEFLGSCSDTKLIQCVWSIDGLSPSFPNKGVVDQYVRPETVLFHRCKDGTLIDRMLEKQGFVGMIQHFKSALGKKRTKAASGKSCIIQLGRFGDVINALPAAYHVARTEGNPVMMVQKDYASILEGVSYVEPLVWDGHFTDVHNAQESIRGKFVRVLMAQVYGRDYSVTTECDSFCAESWRQMGLLGFMHRTPLVFDRRSKEREAALAAKFIDPKNRNLLVNLSGHSSPMEFAPALMKRIVEKWKRECNIVDLQTVKAHRLYDLLGLYDAADCLVTLDTSTLHLAAASEVPSIQLITDKPTIWHGARPKGNVTLHMRYREAQERADEIDMAIQKCLQGRRLPKLHHVYSKYIPNDLEVQRRYDMSMRTHQMAYDGGGWVPVPVEDCMLPRLFEDGKRKLPYVKDLVDVAFSGCAENDVIVFTNIDTCFTPGLRERIWDAMSRVDACYSFRRDFKRLTGPVNQSDVDSALLYPGCDLFAFKRTWWEKHRKTMPDMLLAAEAWDWCMRLLIDETQAPVRVAYNNWIYHERHDSEWEKPVNRSRLPSQLHNKRLAAPFLSKRGEKVPDHFKL